MSTMYMYVGTHAGGENETAARIFLAPVYICTLQWWVFLHLYQLCCTVCTPWSSVCVQYFELKRKIKEYEEYQKKWIS